MLHQKKDSWIAVDFGTSNSCAYLETEPVRFGYNQELLPSILKLVGKTLATIGPSEVSRPRDPFLRRSKTLLGRSKNDGSLDGDMADIEYASIEKETTVYKVGEVTVSCLFVVARLLRSIFLRAKAQRGEFIDKVAIAIPANFSEDQRRAMADAARIAGAQEVKLIEEPVAACITHWWNSTSKSAGGSYSLVIDIGAGTSDVSLIYHEKGTFVVKGNEGFGIAGAKLTSELRKFALAKYPGDKESIDLQELEDECEMQKKMMMDTECGEIRINLCSKSTREVVGRIAIDRDEFNRVFCFIWEKTVLAIEKIFQDCGQSLEDVDTVIVTGGTCLLSRMTELCKEKFPAAHIYHQAPEKCVAEGVALWTSRPEINVTQVLPRSIGIEVDDLGAVRMRTLIKRNTALPARGKIRVQTKKDQRALELTLCEGEEEEEVEKNTLLREVIITNISPEEQQAFEIEVEIPEPGQVKAWTELGGEQHNLTVEVKPRLSEEEVEKYRRCLEAGEFYPPPMASPDEQSEVPAIGVTDAAGRLHSPDRGPDENDGGKRNPHPHAVGNNTVPGGDSIEAQDGTQEIATQPNNEKLDEEASLTTLKDVESEGRATIAGSADEGEIQMMDGSPDQTDSAPFPQEQTTATATAADERERDDTRSEMPGSVEAPQIGPNAEEFSQDIDADGESVLAEGDVVVTAQRGCSVAVHGTESFVQSTFRPVKDIAGGPQGGTAKTAQAVENVGGQSSKAQGRSKKRLRTFGRHCAAKRRKRS